MHAAAEIVIPPHSNIEQAVKQIMHGFRKEEYNENDGPYKHCDWWDFYVIGGRFSGRKRQALLNPAKLKAFYAKLAEMKVMVHGLVCGKEELAAPFVEPVDALWREMFPGFGDRCWLFNHVRDQYGKEGIYTDDICKVHEVPERLTASRLIIAREHWDKNDHPDELEAHEMLIDEFWNGRTWQKTDWDGNVKQGIKRLAAWMRKHLKPKYVPDLTNWMCVTVDYHN